MLSRIILLLVLITMIVSIAQAEYYAVLINGFQPDTTEWYSQTYNWLDDAQWNDTFLFWEMLWNFGWKDDNIYVLFGEGSDFDLENDRYDAYARYHEFGIDSIVDYSGGYEDVENIFDWLSDGNPSQGIPQMTEDDNLFVWTFGHGSLYSGPDGSGLQLDLGDSIMVDTVFAPLVDQCSYDKRIFFMQQCHSGGFIDDLENDDTFIMTATDWWWAGAADDSCADGDDPYENEYYQTYPDDTIRFNHGEFDYHVINAARLETIRGNSLASFDSVDVDSNGLASLSEIWDWEESKDTVADPHYPQVSDSGSIGDDYYLNIPPYKPSGLEGDRVNYVVQLSWNRNIEYDLDYYEIFKRTYDDSLQSYSEWYSLYRTTDTTYTDNGFFPSAQASDTVFYKITAVDEAGQQSEYSDIFSAPGDIRPLGDDDGERLLISREMISHSCYPNPFNPATTITFSVPDETYVTLEIFNITGRLVSTLVNKWCHEGTYKAVFKAENLPSGMYLYRLKLAEYTITEKIVLTK